MKQYLSGFGITRDLEIKLHCLKIKALNTVVKPERPEKLYKCSRCSHSSAYFYQLKAHVRRIHDLVKPFKCAFCTYGFITKGELQKHIRTHTGERRYACPLCTHRSVTQDNLNSHLRTHTGEKPYKCSHCAYATCHSSNLKYHTIARHTQECMREGSTHFRRFTCDMCPYSSSRKGNLGKHMQTHTGEKPFACPLCPYAGAQKYLLMNHLRTHTGEKPYSCSTCDYSTAQKDSLKLHETTQHSDGPRNFSCPICSKLFKTKKTLRAHIPLHTGEKPNKCRFCEKEFLSFSNKNVHEKTCKLNPGPIPKKCFKCNVCDYSAMFRGYLQQHMRTHSGEKREGCSFCGKRFGAANNRRRHEIICKLNPKQKDQVWVAEQKKFKCQFCEYSCPQKSNLDHHLRSHKGDRPHACEFCSRRFGESSSKRRHELICKSSRN